MNDGTLKAEPAESQQTKSKSTNKQLKQLEIGFLVLGASLGFVHVWADHHYLRNADVMSYLDVAEAYLRKDWHAAINAYWGPLYSWLIALTLWITRPSTYWKFAIVHLLNFGIYLFAFACFGFMMRGLVSYLQTQRTDLRQADLVGLPDWAVIALGYSLFIWSSVLLVTVPLESPDMLVASFLFLATGLLLRIRTRPSWLLFVLLGITLGFGYLAKAVMLPLAAVFIMASVFAVGNFRRALPRVLVATVFFVFVASPFVVALSETKGRFTTGGTGKLNYLWSINQIPNTHWQGEQPGSGQPKHPTRKIFDNPPSFEFGEPIRGTYPVWYDPTYWYEGSVSHFDLRGQIRVFVNCIKAYYDVFQSWGVQYGLLVGLLTLYLMSRRSGMLLSDFMQQWTLIIPAVAGLGLYSLVAVEKRYVAAFIVLLWLALFSAVRLRNTPESVRLLRIIALVLTVTVILTTIGSSMRETSLTISQLVNRDDPAEHQQWQVSEGLREMGLVSSDRVAFIGDSFRAFWAHLLEVRIVAEVRRNEVDDFWKANSTVKGQVIDAFGRNGVKAVVAETPPPGVDLSGWRRIRDTDYYVYFLQR